MPKARFQLSSDDLALVVHLLSNAPRATIEAHSSMLRHKLLLERLRPATRVIVESIALTSEQQAREHYQNILREWRKRFNCSKCTDRSELSCCQHPTNKLTNYL